MNKEFKPIIITEECPICDSKFRRVVRKREHLKYRKACSKCREKFKNRNKFSGIWIR